jgi:hypothetical protein
MNFHQFHRLLPQFTQVYDKLEGRRKLRVVLTGRKRRRQIGGGAQFANTVPDRLLMLLLYYRLYLTQEFRTEATEKAHLLGRGVPPSLPGTDIYH